MKISVIRKIDCYLGPVICRLLLFLRYISGRNSMTQKRTCVEDCRNILVIKFFGMGTILLASPALRALKGKYPNSRITILTLSRNREICGLLPSIDRVLCLELNNMLSFMISFTKTMFIVRKEGYDVVFNLEFTTYFSALVTLLVTLMNKRIISIGFQSPIKWRNKAHDINVSFDHSRHITKIFGKVVKSIGVDDFEPSFESEKAFLLERMDKEYVERLFCDNEVLAKADQIVCVNINAGDLCAHRKWPRGYFASVVSELVDRQGIAVVLIGGNNDMRYVSEFRGLIKPSCKIVDVSGETNIKKLIAILSKCDLLITNDSGPLHLAQSIEVPTISFFGPETPYLYGPIDTTRHFVFYTDLHCSPCLNIYNSKFTYCKNNICLKLITPEMVLKIIDGKYNLLK